MKVDKPSHFTAQPGEVLNWLRQEFSSDVLLRFLQLVTHQGIQEACDDIMRDLEGKSDNSREFVAGMRYVKELIDPGNSGGNYPSQIMCNDHARCPDVPRCTPWQRYDTGVEDNET